MYNVIDVEPIEKKEPEKFFNESKLRELAIPLDDNFSKQGSPHDFLDTPVFLDNGMPISRIHSPNMSSIHGLTAKNKKINEKLEEQLNNSLNQTSFYFGDGFPGVPGMRQSEKIPYQYRTNIYDEEEEFVCI